MSGALFTESNRCQQETTGLSQGLEIGKLLPVPVAEGTDLRAPAAHTPHAVTCCKFSPRHPREQN